LVEHDNKVLLCRRSIQPSYGLWYLMISIPVSWHSMAAITRSNLSLEHYATALAWDIHAASYWHLF
jgi:hypothetical protein